MVLHCAFYHSAQSFVPQASKVEDDSRDLSPAASDALHCWLAFTLGTGPFGGGLPIV